MKLTCANSRSGILSLRLATALLACVLIPLLAFAAAPGWWSQRGVVNPNVAPDDYALANQGQLKNIAKAAVAEFDAHLPGGAGDSLHNLVNTWSQPDPQRNDYAPVNLGQLKNVAKPFYDRLITIRYVDNYPWIGVPNPPDDFAIANLGQIKNLFTFDLLATDLIHDSDQNGLPDWWEKYYFGHMGIDPNAPATRGDGLTNLQAFQQGLNPVDFYNNSIPNLEKLGGDKQTAGPGEVLVEPIAVRITNSVGQPIANAPLTFSGDASGVTLASASDGSFTPDLAVRTGPDGIASAYVRLPASLGSASITATIRSGQNTSSLTFEEDIVAPAVPTLSVYSGDNQNASRLKFLFYPLVVQLTDANGAPVANTFIAFEVAAGAGGIVIDRADTPVSTLNVQTDENGFASVSFFTPDTVGLASVSATVGSGSDATVVVFHATVRADPTDPPAAPTGLVATKNADGSTELSWTDNSDNEDEFIIEHQKADGSWEQIGIVGPDQTTFVVPAN